MLSSQRHRVKGFGAFENNVNLCLIAANCNGTIKLEFPLIFHRHSGCFEELSESSSFEWLWNSRMRLPFYSLAFSNLYILKLLPSRSLSEPLERTFLIRAIKSKSLFMQKSASKFGVKFAGSRIGV